MKKGFCLAFALMLAIVPLLSSQALTDDERQALAKTYIKEDVVFRKEKTDDGYLEVMFRTPDGAREYDLKLDGQGNVAEIKYELDGGRGGASIGIDEDAAKKIVLDAHPDAVNLFVAVERDDGRYEYHVRFDSAELSGEYELNAFDGTILEYNWVFLAAVSPLFAAAQNALRAAHPAAVVLECEEDVEKGARVYEGKARDNGIEYEFRIEMATGTILKWKMDD